ncbi:MAG: GntR family transcriptional regulator [Actinomycetota bacterium]
MAGPIGDHHRPLREVVADEIRSMILRGDLVPGERIQETAIAEQFGVSRNPVREAIRVLEATGLIDVVPRIGASVALFDVEDLRQLLEIRAVLEALAAESAATHHRPEDLIEIDRHLGDGQRASGAGDLVAAATAHHRLLQAIDRASGNRHLGMTLEPLRQRTELVFSVLGGDRHVVSWDQHQRIRDAIAAGDGSNASQAAAEHLSSVMAALSAGRAEPVDDHQI